MTSSSRTRRQPWSRRDSSRPRRSSRYSRTVRQANAPNAASVRIRSTTAQRPGVGATISGSFLEHLLGDDELHDLARPFVDLGDLRVAVVALGREVREVTV